MGYSIMNERARERSRLGNAARQSATERLIKAHRDEYTALYEEEAALLGIRTHRKAREEREAARAALLK